MKHELHPDQAALSRALYVIRLRHGPFRSGGRWYRRTVAQRREGIEYEWARRKPAAWHPKSWQPPEGRESPREEWMDWRKSRTHYAYAGWMRHRHGMAPALIGRALLYDLSSERRSPFCSPSPMAA